MKFKKTKLPNGLRVIVAPVKGQTVTVMALVETGSEYESKSENGLSHFLEHMCFKGTTNRPNSLDIARELDSIGAENNAFTAEEVTGYWAKGNKKHFKKILEVISDLYLNPTLPATDLEKERGVILQEISMYEDLPQRKVWEVLNELLYGDTPAGRSILGPRSNIKKFKRSDFINYRKKHYVADKTIVVIAGDVDPRQALELTKKHFKEIPKSKRVGKSKIADAQKSPAIKIEHKKTDQTHMIIAFRGYKANDPRRPAQDLLAEVLGHGMSSRLFQKMREELGACYYVRTATDELTDHGFFAISTGIEARRAEEVTRAILGECHRMKSELVGESELNKAKEHYLGHLAMRLETTDSVADFYADQEIGTGKLVTPEEVEKKIRKVTAKDVMKVAQDLFVDEKLNLALIGDVKNASSLKRVLTLK